jgi:hypothetical protein
VSRTPAAELARLKVAYPGWIIRAIEPGKGTGYTAHRRDGRRRIYAPTVAALEPSWRTRSAATADPSSPSGRAGYRRASYPARPEL